MLWAHALGRPCILWFVSIGLSIRKKALLTVSMCQVAMNVSWAILGLLTCATPKAWGLGSATLLMTSINHTLFSVVFYLKDPSVLRNLKKSR